MLGRWEIDTEYEEEWIQIEMMKREEQHRREDEKSQQSHFFQ